MPDARWHDLDAALASALARHPSWRRVSKHVVEVRTIHDERHHRVRFELVRDHWELQCVVLGAQQVTQSDRGWRELAKRAWLRNDAGHLVTFTFDDQDRLIGWIRHPAATFDEAELELYVEVMASECDRFEFLLSGLDEF